MAEQSARRQGHTKTLDSGQCQPKGLGWRGELNSGSLKGVQDPLSQPTMILPHVTRRTLQMGLR